MIQKEKYGVVPEKNTTETSFSIGIAFNLCWNIGCEKSNGAKVTLRNRLGETYNIVILTSI